MSSHLPPPVLVPGYEGLVVAVLRLAIRDSRRTDALGAEARAFLASEDVVTLGELLGLKREDIRGRLQALG